MREILRAVISDCRWDSYFAFPFGTIPFEMSLFNCRSLCVLTFATYGVSACAQSAPFSVAGLFGKSKTEVESMLGEGKMVRGSYRYTSVKFPKLIIDYGDESSYKGMRDKVLSVSIYFSKKPTNWKAALKAVGLSGEGVVQGTGNAKGWFKNIKGIPKAFIGTFHDYEGWNLAFTHWSFLPSDLMPFTKPKD